MNVVIRLERKRIRRLENMKEERIKKLIEIVDIILEDSEKSKKLFDDDLERKKFIKEGEEIKKELLEMLLK